MRISMKALYRAGLVSAFACLCVAQTNQTAVGPKVVARSGQMAWFSVSPGGGNPFGPVTGIPYSAEQTTERVQTLADGTRITQTNLQSKLYRDSQGRTRTERTLFPSGQAGGAGFPSFIEIIDPVAGYRYMLDQRSHTARRTIWARPDFRETSKTSGAFMGAVPGKAATVITSPQAGAAALLPTPAPSSGPALVAGAAARPHAEITRESLGTQNIEGVQATGTRTTILYPEDSFGNDRPVTTTSESWTSPELKTVILSIESDPRYGDTTTRLTNIMPTEPDSSLFEIPDGYTIVDQPAPVLFAPASK